MAAQQSVVLVLGPSRGCVAAKAGQGRSLRWIVRPLLVCIALTLSAVGSFGDETGTARDLRGRAHERFAKGDYAGAIADVTALIQIEPKNWGAFWDRAAYREASHDWPGAVADYTKALELDPGNPYPPTFNRGQARRYAGDFRGAVADFTRALELKPGERHPILMARAFANYDLLDLDSAISDCSSILAIRPDSVRVYFLRGLCRFARGAFPESIPDFRAVLDRVDGSKYQSDWDHVRAYLFVARAFMGQRAEAQAEIKSYVASRANSAAPSWGMQLAGYLLGDATEADLMKKAEAGTSKESAELRRCEVLLFVGLRDLLDGNKGAAASALKRCLAAGSKISHEHAVASEFLRRT